MIWPACSICGSSDFEPWAASVLPPVLRKTIPLEWEDSRGVDHRM